MAQFQLAARNWWSLKIAFPFSDTGKGPRKVTRNLPTTNNVNKVIPKNSTTPFATKPVLIRKMDALLETALMLKIRRGSTNVPCGDVPFPVHPPTERQGESAHKYGNMFL